jgi:hypothetical protein
MNNPTLINGFEDIITFIKQQDKRIENLVKQNEELKRRNEYYINMFNFVVESETEKVKEINKLMKLVQVYKNTIESQSDYSNSDEDNHKAQ